MAKIIDTILLLAGLSLLITGAVWLCGAYGLLGSGLALTLLSVLPAGKSPTDRHTSHNKGGM